MDTLFRLDQFENFKNVSQELLTSLYYFEKISNASLETDELEKAKHEMRTIISTSNFDIQIVNEFFKNREWPDEKVEHFLSLMKKNWSELLGAALNHYNSTYGETITNFDWLVKIVLGTSELKTLQYPLMQLILSTVNKDGHHKDTMYDINKDMLLKMINALENI